MLPQVPNGEQAFYSGSCLIWPDQIHFPIPNNHVRMPEHPRLLKISSLQHVDCYWPHVTGGGLFSPLLFSQPPPRKF